MHGLELVVVLGLAVLLGGMAARRLRVPPPVLLLIVGVLLGFVPGLHTVNLPSEVVLLLFLPALLYWESLNTSLREIRANLRMIVPLFTALVFVAAAAVATVAHTFGLHWGPAWVLGAATAPTDATAVAVLARSLPRQLVTVIHVESLANDGTALVIYGLAVTSTVNRQRLSPGETAGWLVLSYAGGAGAGLLAAWIALGLRRMLDDPLLENTVSLLTPFLAFLLAELVHGSGVLSVVVCGLVLSRIGPRRIRADTRQQSFSFWRVSTFVVNAVLFVLVGWQLQATARDVDDIMLPSAFIAVAAISAVLIGARTVWVCTTPYLARLLRRWVGRIPDVSLRGRVVIALTGFRGAVSMAAALAVPHTLADGSPFPGRSMIVFVTSGVIAITLVVQGLLLPHVVRWARLPADTDVEDELRLAEIAATEDALAKMDKVAAERAVEHSVVDRMRHEYEKHLAVLRAHGHEDDDNPGRRAEADFASLRLGLLCQKRETAVRLRDAHRIDDTVLRQILTHLDAEEIRLSRRDVPD
ncbi:Na+/H+ antiporter [Planosporangium sp. 12N6]|uniref:Na+/H+ antiporter n=1 Tax=Planosporangium spinosum TaxID=3402278 RepID=UPI003CF66D93